jgi:hypothetical protein
MPAHPAFMTPLLPPDARLLAEVSRSMAGSQWTTKVWVQPDGLYGAMVVQSAGNEVVACARQAGAASLSALDQALSRALSAGGPEGNARIAVLSSAAVALEEANSRAA